MEDLSKHLTDAYVEWFVEHLETLLSAPPPERMVEIPLDHPDLFTRPQPTYGGRQMGKILPTAEEFSFVARLGAGLQAMPGHE